LTPHLVLGKIIQDFSTDTHQFADCEVHDDIAF